MTNFSFFQFEKGLDPLSVSAIAAERILPINPAAYVFNFHRVMEFAVKWMCSADKQLVAFYDDRLASKMKSPDEIILCVR